MDVAEHIAVQNVLLFAATKNCPHSDDTMAKISHSLVCVCLASPISVCLDITKLILVGITKSTLPHHWYFVRFNWAMTRLTSPLLVWEPSTCGGFKSAY